MTPQATSAKQNAACVPPDLFLTREPTDDHGGLRHGPLLAKRSRRIGPGIAKLGQILQKNVSSQEY